jgi:beta-lactamase regulating signal transducer with metallopeptidase domain
MINEWFNGIGHTMLELTWRASLVVLLVLALRPLAVRWLPLKFMPWLWLIVAVKLLCPVAPACWWSLDNTVGLFARIPASPATPSIPPVVDHPVGTPVVVSIFVPDSDAPAISLGAVAGLIWFVGVLVIGGGRWARICLFIGG